MIYSLQSFNFRVLIASVIVFGITSCGGKKEEQADTPVVTVADSPAVAAPAESMLQSGPSPTEIPAMLEATGANYDKALINDPNKVNSYTTISDKAALNLGVYATDAAYNAVYSKADAASLSLKSAAKLGESLGIGGGFDLILKNRLEKNLSNRDSLKKITDDGIIIADQFLKQNERNASAALVATGMFVEGLYISTQLVDKYPHDLPDASRDIILIPLIRTILEQKSRIENLIKMLENIKNDSEATKTLEELKTIKSLFDKLNLDEHIKNNKGGEILKDSSLKEITKAIAQLRGEYVK
jgi:hypothetical protein